MNSKYVLGYGKGNRRVATCNLCGCQNDLEAAKAMIKADYFYSDTSNIPELTNPTIDYVAPKGMKHTVPFLPHYIFMLDISQHSIDLGLPSYVR